MDDLAEHFFLDELRSLCLMALVHAEVIEHASAAWVAANAGLWSMLANKKQDRTPENASQWEAQYSRYRGDRMLAQNDIFLHLESYLGVHGRIAQILSPGSRGQIYQGRAAALAALLGQTSSEWKGDYQARSKWAHFDEYLDDQCKAGSNQVSPQKVCTSAELLATPDSLTMRLITADDLHLRLPVVGSVDLRTFFARVRALQPQVDARLGDWSSRHSR